MKYRRDYEPGRLYFFTVVIENRREPLLIQYIDELRATFRRARAKWQFEIIAIVILPEHLHALLKLPDSNCNYAGLWNSIKASFSKKIPRTEKVSSSRIKRGERGSWQRRYWEHCIRGETDLENHIHYIHYNLVKHGVVKRAGDWPYSSIHRYLRKRMLPRQRASVGAELAGSHFGEPEYCRGASFVLTSNLRCRLWLRE